MLEYAIEGSAKTPITEGVRNKLITLGKKVHICAPFAAANAEIQEDDIYEYWFDRAKRRQAVNILKNIISKATARETDIILYDRHWLTIERCLSYLPIEERLWDKYIPTFFIEAPINKNSPRILTKSEKVEKEVYLSLTEKYSEYIIAKYRVDKKTQPLEPIIESIVGHILHE